MTTDPIDASTFARFAHGNQKYGDQPYIVHLRAVASEMFELLVSERGLLFFDSRIALCAAWLHDVLEDTPTTEKIIRSGFGDGVAELVIAVTDASGVNRKERKARTYPKIRAAGPLAVALKLADRIANVRATLEEKKFDITQMYRDEAEEFHRSLYRFEDGLDGAWDKLSKLLATDARATRQPPTETAK